MIFKGNQIGTNPNFTMNVDPGYKYIKNFRGGKQWYTIEPKEIVSNISFKLGNENKELLSNFRQCIIFRLSIQEI